MIRRRILPDVPQADVAATQALFESYGWTAQTVDQGGGLWSIIVTKEEDAAAIAATVPPDAAKPTKTNGISLHLGLNGVDPSHYAGWPGELGACEADAHDMNGIARAAGFAAKTLLTKSATRAAVVSQIAAASKKLAAGGIFFLTYSGHGGQTPDLNGDESDGQDETWCLFDGQLIDDELYEALSKFKAGVRVFVLSDSCHSGTVTKEIHLANIGLASQETGSLPDGKGAVVYRNMPGPVALRTYRQNKAFYDKILKNPAFLSSKARILASILLISGCQDNQSSSDGTFNGLFTGTLLKVWNEGTFKGDYLAFHKAIASRMPPYQTPNLYWAADPDPVFAHQLPFHI